MEARLQKSAFTVDVYLKEPCWKRAPLINNVGGDGSMKKSIMRTFLTFALLFSLSALLIAQDTSGVAFIDTLTRKSEASMGDAVKMFVMVTGKTSRNFTADSQLLRDAGILDARTYNEGDVLRRGSVAFMAARLLRLDDSLMYNLFGSRRYALTACRAADIMHGEAGEHAVVSGSELIDIMGNVTEAMGGDE